MDLAALVVYANLEFCVGVGWLEHSFTRGCFRRKLNHEYIVTVISWKNAENLPLGFLVRHHFSDNLAVPDSFRTETRQPLPRDHS